MTVGTIHRAKFPRIRSIVKRGKILYQVDPRPHGKQVSFPLLAEAKKRANEIAADFAKLGSEGVNFTTVLRVMAQDCERQLKPWNKTVADATAHYIRFLQDQHTKFQSKTVDSCVDEWVADKHSSNRRKLRSDTLRDIKQTGKLLKQLFGGRRILEADKLNVEKYLDSLSVELRRKENLRNRMGQFFNWCKRSRYIETNPCDEIEIGVEDAEVVILSADEANNMLALAEIQFPKLVAYIALGLFAGLRPTEARFLRWDDISLTNKQIKVRKEITKVKTTRLVKDLQPNLLEWLQVWGEGKTGQVTGKNFTNDLRAFRAAAGYAIGGKNANGRRWTQDVLRHSYASYWLARFHNVPQLAYWMGNSVEVIKKHYENIVPNPADLSAYWNLVPDAARKRMEAEARERDALQRLDAETQSNCGRAIRDDDGNWMPIMDESLIG